MTTVATRRICRHCGSSFILPDEDRHYCLLCGRPYHDWSDYGRIGGLQTTLRYGKEYMAELGRRGGLAGRLPTLSERQQSALEVQSQVKGGRLPNSLKELKELYKLRQRSKPVINGNGGSPAVEVQASPKEDD